LAEHRKQVVCSSGLASRELRPSKKQKSKRRISAFSRALFLMYLNVDVNIFTMNWTDIVMLSLVRCSICFAFLVTTNSNKMRPRLYIPNMFHIANRVRALFFLSFRLTRQFRQ
jgi:hypothetical protein